MSGKRKLDQFAEIKAFPNVLEVEYKEVFNKPHELQGRWAKEVFSNNNPVILELGCGKGEYTVGLARNYADQNFIGVDIKGARLWRGAKTAIEDNLTNCHFLRSRIDFIDSFFQKDEISQVWITFPDPQPQISREKKRLTSPRFLKKYLSFLKKDGVIHLKTDAISLYEYSLETANSMSLKVDIATSQLYKDLPKLKLTEVEKRILEIPTFYEQKFIEVGHEICYLKLIVN